MQKNAMNETFWRFPIECRRITEIGKSAGGGIARQYSTCGIANRLAQSERPIGMPSTTPIAEPIAKPSRIRIKLGTMSERNCANSHRSWNWARIVDGGGQNRLSAERAHHSQTEDHRHRHRDLRGDLERLGPACAHAASRRCDGCQRSTRCSNAVKTRCVPSPSTPVASASA